MRRVLDKYQAALTTGEAQRLLALKQGAALLFSAKPTLLIKVFLQVDRTATAAD